MLTPLANSTTDIDEQRVLARVGRRFIPLAFICYVVAYLDRVNVGFVANELQRDLHLSTTAYGVAAGLFFLSYCLCEVPSNLILERVGARRWIARIMITWGLWPWRRRSRTMRGRSGRALLLGVAEAGFFRNGPLLHILVSGVGARANRRAVHDGGAGRGDPRRAARVDPAARPGFRASRLASGYFSSRASPPSCWCDCPRRADRSSRRRAMAYAGSARVAWAADGRRSRGARLSRS